MSRKGNKFCSVVQCVCYVRAAFISQNDNQFQQTIQGMPGKLFLFHAIISHFGFGIWPKDWFHFLGIDMYTIYTCYRMYIHLFRLKFGFSNYLHNLSFLHDAAGSLYNNPLMHSNHCKWTRNFWKPIKFLVTNHKVYMFAHSVSISKWQVHTR